jgi:hypothetical protein
MSKPFLQICRRSAKSAYPTISGNHKALLLRELHKWFRLAIYSIKCKHYDPTNSHDTKNNHSRTSPIPHSQKPLPHFPQLGFSQIQWHRSPDWELARPPIFNPQISQVAFTNGLNIVAQSNAITFIESLSTKPLEDIKIPAVIRKYVEALPRTDYQTLSINPRSFVTFEEGDENAASEYITSTLLSKDT